MMMLGSRVHLFATLLAASAVLSQTACTCDMTKNFVPGATYSQQSLTDYCGSNGCSANPVYGAPNNNERAVAYCQSKCEGGVSPASSTCAGFFYQRHGNGHEICGFFNTRPDWVSAVAHGHSAGSRLCRCGNLRATTTPLATTTVPTEGGIQCMRGYPYDGSGGTLGERTRVMGYGSRDACEQHVFSLGLPIRAFAFSCYMGCKCDYWTSGYTTDDSFHTDAPFDTCFVTSTGVMTTPEPTTTTTTTIVSTSSMSTPPPTGVIRCMRGYPYGGSRGTLGGHTRMMGYGNRQECQQQVMSLGLPISAFAFSCFMDCKCDYWTSGRYAAGSVDTSAPFETCFVE